MNKKLTKWILSLTLVLALMVCGLWVDANAASGDPVASGKCGPQVTWELDAAGTLTISGEGQMEWYSSTADKEGYYVPWVDYRLDIKKVVVTEGVTELTGYVFEGCSNLTEVILPTGLEALEYGAFRGCGSLTKINIPDTVTRIASSVFCECSSLKQITIPENITVLGDSVFESSGIESIEWPAAVTTVPYAAFWHCANLRTVVLPEGVETIELWAFADCGSLTEIALPSTLKTIVGSAFEESGLKSIRIPKGITEILNHAFSDCASLEEVILPEGVTTIDDGAFWDCTALQTINFPQTLLKIGNNAFNNCASLAVIDLPDTITEIGSSAFANCDSLKEVTIPGSIGILPNSMFACSNALEKVTLQDGVVSIGAWAFDECDSLKKVVFPGSVTSVSDAAFMGCYDLTAIAFEGDAPEIYYNAFSGVTAKVYYPADNFTWTAGKRQAYSGYLTWEPYWKAGENLWAYLKDGTLTVTGTGKMDYYLSAYDVPWGGMAGRIQRVVVEKGATSIGRYAFAGCTQLTGISIAGTVEHIGESAFQGCTSLTSAVIPKGVTNIGGYLFQDCTNLTAVTIAGTVKSIGESSFQGCTNLESITIPEGVESLGQSMLSGCTKLKTVKLPNTLTRMDMYIFEQCTALTAIEIPDSVQILNMSAFEGCINLKTVKLPAAMRTMSYGLFSGCKSLLEVTVPADVNLMDAYIFSGCSNLKKVHFLGDAPRFADQTFAGVTITAYYPDDNDTWTADKLQNYGGKVTWKLAGQVDAPVITKLENTATGIKLTWGKVDGAERYRVYVKTSSGWKSLGSTTANTYIYTAAQSGKTYNFTVRCVNAANTKFTSDYNTTGWRQTFVAAPVISKLESAHNGVTLTWKAVSGAGKYRVYVSNGSGWTKIGDTAATSFTYTAAVAGQSYTFTVRPMNANATAFVGAYNTAGWKHTYYPIPVISGLTSEANGIRINWNTVRGAAKYRVYVKSTKGWTKLADAKGTSYVYTGAMAGQTYSFTIRALNADGTAFVSSCNTTGWSHRYTPTPRITGMGSTISGIQLNWEAVKGAGAYRVFVKTSKGWAKLADVADTTYVYTGAKVGLRYTFTVRALNASGTAFVSGYNTTGWSGTYAPAPEITELESTTGGIRMSWSAINGAAKYRVYVKTSKGWAKLADVTDNSYVYTGAKLGASYTFTVRCVNAAGTACTSAYNPTGWTCTYVPTPVISGLESTTGGIRLSWNAINGATGYRVYVKNGNRWSKVAEVADTSYVYAGAKLGESYTFTLVAANSKCSSFYNGNGWKYTFAPVPAATLANATNGIRISWGKINGAEKYRVYVKTSKGWTKIGDTTGTSFLWTGAKTGLTYTFTVRCINAAGTAYTSGYNTTGWQITRK